MKKHSAILALLLLAAVPAQADEPDLESLLEDAKPVGDRWERCAATQARAGLRGRRSVEDVAKRALDACKREEAALRTMLKREIGPARAEAVTALVRNIYQTNLVRAITALRER